MTPIVIQTDISRPPDEVYTYVTDPLRFPEWQRDVVRVEMVDDQPPRVGSRFLTTRRFAGSENTLTQEIREISPPRRWSAEGIDGVIRANGTLIVEPLDDGNSSRVTFEIDYEGHGLGRVIMPLVISQTRKGAPISFRRLKERLESGSGEAG